MSEDNKTTPEESPTPEVLNEQLSSPQPITPTPETVGRAELLDKARAFLHSPQVVHEDVTSKRRFLSEKGLDATEIDTLLQELPPSIPLVPPRTYPQPPPSNLPNLIVGVLRIASWAAGGSAALLLVYFRYIYPRLARSFEARLSLRAHQKELLAKLTDRLSELKSEQASAFAVLPRPDPFRDVEEPKYADCHTLDGLVKVAEGKTGDIAEFSLLRCALEEAAAQSKRPTAPEILETIADKVTYATEEETAASRERLWSLLHDHPLFFSEPSAKGDTWAYTPPPPPPPPAPLVAALHALRAALPAPSASSTLQHALQTLTDLTGYIATQTYVGVGYTHTSTPAPAEEEARREIRALKGLVLNRRSFMPAIP